MDDEVLKLSQFIFHKLMKSTEQFGFSFASDASKHWHDVLIINILRYFSLLIQEESQLILCLCKSIPTLCVSNI